MPTYQYACTECGDPLEVVQKFTDEPLTECPACRGRLRKVFNSVGIVFKGSGFYRTDSRDSGSKTKTSSDAAAASSTSTPSSTSSSPSSNSSSGESTSTSSGATTPAAKAASA